MTFNKTIIFILLFLCSSVFAQTSIGYNKWQIDDTTFSLKMGKISNYPDTDTTFAEISNNFVAEGDSVYVCNTSILKTRINDNGVATVTLKWNDTTYEVTQVPRKLIWINTQTKNWTDIVSSLSWSEPAKDSNIVKWNFPGFNYLLIKKNARVSYQINFRDTFLDSAVVLYNQRADSQYIALGNVHEYTFTNIDDTTLTNIAEVKMKRLKQLGNYAFDFSKQNLQWKGSDTSTIIPIRQRWIKKANKIYCIEFVMMHDVKKVHEDYPASDVWHNTDLSVQIGSSSDDAGHETSTWGTSANMYYFGTYGSHLNFEGYRWTNVTIPQGATITSCYLELRCALTYTKEPQMSYYADDVDNAATFSTEADRTGRTKTTANVTITSGWGTWTAGTWYEIPGATPVNLGSLLQEVVNRGSWASGNAFAILSECTGGADNTIMRHYTYDQSVDYGAKLNIVYTTGGVSAEQSRRRNIILRGSVYNEKNIFMHSYFAMSYVCK